MNGTNSGIVTPRQVQRMQEEIDKIAAEAKQKIEQSVNEFLKKTGKEWADKESVEMAKKISNQMNGVVAGLGDSTYALKSGIVNVGNYFAKQARMSSINAPTKRDFTTTINPTVVKETFDDGESYGVVVTKSLDRVASDLKNLTSDLKSLGVNTAQELRSIHAYGCEIIHDKISETGQKIGDTLSKTVNTVANAAEDAIIGAAKRYDLAIENAQEVLNNIKISEKLEQLFD